MAPVSSSPAQFPSRTEAELLQLQRSGDLQVRSGAEFRCLVRDQGLAEAYRQTHVLVAGNAGFSDQASLVLHLGPTDPPMRVRRFRLGGAEGIGGHGNCDLVLPLAQGGAQVLEALLRGERLPFSASGLSTSQQPRLELETTLGLEGIGAGRLLLHRGLSEGGVVVVSSRDGLTPTPWGPVLGPLSTALCSCSGADSIGHTMPGFSQLGPGSPVLVGGAIGWVGGAGSGHNPQVKRGSSGHARSPGACCALEADLHALQSRWLRASRQDGGGSGLLVAIAAPVPLIHEEVARRAACSNEALELPVLDYGIPRRVRPSLGSVSYAALERGTLQLDQRRLSCAPAHSPRLAAEIAEELAELLRNGQFPLRLPLLPLPQRSALRPLE